MNRIILSIAAAAVASAAFVGGAQANTIMRFPYKSAPYAVPHDHTKASIDKVAVKPTVRHIDGRY